jgi:hypothetical protein
MSLLAAAPMLQTPATVRQTSSTGISTSNIHSAMAPSIFAPCLLDRNPDGQLWRFGNSGKELLLKIRSTLMLQLLPATEFFCGQ